MSGNLWMFSDMLDDEDIEMLKRDFITYYQGADYYGLGLKMFTRMAHEAGAVYKIGKKVLIRRSIFDEYLRQQCKSNDRENRLSLYDESDEDIVIEEEDETMDDYRAKKMGVIFQSYNLLQNATAAENILLAVNISGKKMGMDEVYTLLSQVGIDREKAGRRVLKLSGGEQQRVAIARAIAGGSPILAADEPTGNLDTDNEASIMGIFSHLVHDMGKCVIVVTHSQKASEYADEVLALQKGCLAGES